MNGAAGAGAAAAAIAKAIKASGVLVRVDPEDFQTLLRRVSMGPFWFMAVVAVLDVFLVLIIFKGDVRIR